MLTIFIQVETYFPERPTRHISCVLNVRCKAFKSIRNEHELKYSRYQVRKKIKMWLFLTKTDIQKHGISDMLLVQELAEDQ